MATNRFRKGKTTHGQHGDIQAVDPIGKPLTDTFSIELKRGYTKTSFVDVFDREGRGAQCQWEEFVMQAVRGAKESGSRWWMLVQRRDRKRALVFIPQSAFSIMADAGCWDSAKPPLASMTVRIKEGKRTGTFRIAVMDFENFLSAVKPSVIKAIHKGYKP